MRFLVSLRLNQLLAALVVLLLWPADAIQAAPFAGKRVALVVGNSKYPTAPLRNPGNDARAIAKSLKDLGFEVTLRENASQRDLAVAIRQFGSSITPGSAALFYFAGHGMQVKGRNYLVPVDADIQVEDEVPYSAIDANLVLDKMEVGKSAVNIVILDACRNNPFSRRFRSSATGLAEMIAPIGTLIAFATAPGSVAQDGAGENGVYTKHLLESIAMPGLPVEQMFKRVRIGVARETNEGQVPWESSSMKGDFAFRDAPAQQAVSQEKLIEEAARAAAERAATLTAERMSREQAARQPQNDRARAEQEALAAEREKLLREREHLAAENEALKRKAAASTQPAPLALAAPTPASQPSNAATGPDDGRPKVGDRWTYRFSDGYGKTLNYSVRIAVVRDKEITDEISIGKSRHNNTFEPGMEWVSRNLGGIVIREISPYLSSLGPVEPTSDWNSIQVPGGSGLYVARLSGTERITVPAGTYDTRKIIVVGDQFVRGSQTRRLTATVWYADKVKRFVKMSFHSPDFSGAPGGDRDVIELIETGEPIRAEKTNSSTGAKGLAVPAITNLPPSGETHDTANLPKVGDSWTYRFSDIYGKSETYSVRITSASSADIVDEVRLGKARDTASFDGSLSITDRRIGNLTLREISPYFLNFGLIQEKPEWKALNVIEGSPPFGARLDGIETITVPAGNFKAHKLVISGQQYRQRFNPATAASYTITLWYAPAAKRLVKAKFDGPTDKETIELVELRLQ